jgi:GDPmannose 4,6-dehydratase
MVTTHMRTALIFGVNGQDGTFLAKHLLNKNYSVIGIGRQKCSRINFSSPNFSYKQLDLLHTNLLGFFLDSVKADFIYHVAAVHTSAGGSYEAIWNNALQVNVASVHTILEHLRDKNPNGQLVFASSGKVFGEPYTPIVNELSPIKNNCLYSITKNTTYHLINFYREHYFTKASVFYLFNHESEFRSIDYFIPKVLNCLVSAKHNPKHKATINTLDFYCDWGSAEEYMLLMIEVAELAPKEDFVLGTSITTFARELVDNIFKIYGLDYRLHLFEKRTEVVNMNSTYYVDTSKLQGVIGCAPKQTIYDVCKKILFINHAIPWI